MKRLVFQSYPNNEIRIGWDELPYPKKVGADLSRERDLERQGQELDTAREQWLSDNKILEHRDTNGTLWRYRRDGEEPVLEKVRDILVITSEVQEVSKTPKDSIAEALSKPVGFTRFTRNARHRLLEGGQICEEKREQGAVGVFVTFTLPGSTHDAYDALARTSGYIANCICQCVRDGKRAESYFWVYERQKRGALHLHLFISLKPGEQWDCYRIPLRSCWYSTLDRISQSSGVDMFRHESGLYCTASRYWRYDYQEVYKSVASYLSKYVSKEAESGFSDVPTKGDVGLFPRRWWYMSRDLSQEIDRRRKSICVEGLSDEELISGIACLEEVAISLDPVLRHEYVADIGRSESRGGCFGRSFRHLFWFNSTEFADIELVLRSEFIRVMSQMKPVRVTYKGFSLDYGGQPIPVPKTLNSLLQ